MLAPASCGWQPASSTWSANTGLGIDAVSYTALLILFALIAFKTATAITVTLPPSSRTKATSLRWRQLDHDGIEYDEWAIDHIRITGWAYGRQQVVNFQLLIAASSTQANWDVRLEYSADFGQTWALAQPDCLPSSSQCTQTLVSEQVVFLQVV